MIQSNGNNTYSVEFQVGGKADYVTVNNELPTYSPLVGGTRADGSNLEFANGVQDMWVGLVEKAYAQLDEQTGVTPGGAGINGDNYADIAGGWGQGLTAITGQPVTGYAIQNVSSSMLASTLSSLQADLAAKDAVIMATGTAPSSGNLIQSHMYSVIAVNAAAGTIALQNPWGANSQSFGLQENFTELISALVNDGATFMATTGKSLLT